MELKSRTVQKNVILELTGRFDAYNAPTVDQWFEKLDATATENIVVNLNGVEFIDSTALALLVRGMKRARQSDNDLVLCGLQGPVQTIITLTRLDKAFNIYEDEEAALKALTMGE
jgi:anti-sigma B factor antagonist